MAKELPFFKFEPSQWENGNIQISSFEAQGIFINVCSMYWQRLGELPYKLAVQKICKGNATAFDSLIEDDIIKIIDGMICIDFLNEQLLEFENVSKVNSENARSGWEKRRKEATAKRPQSEGNAIREDKIRGDKIRGDKIRGDKIRGDKKREVNMVAVSTATFEKRESDFMNQLAPYVQTYGKEMLREFYNYWTEKNPNGKKMRFEMQKVFDVSRRLVTWSKNIKQSKNGKQPTVRTDEQVSDLVDTYLAAKKAGRV